MEHLQVRIILEIMGRPASNVLDALNGLINRLSSEKGVKLLEQTVHDVIAVKESKDLFTTFAELTLELDSVSVFFSVIFAYMPSHVEIISPEIMELRNEDVSMAANSLVRRLHDYDAIAKRLIVDKELLTKKLFEVAPHLFKEKTSEQPKAEEKAEVSKKKPAKKKSLASKKKK
jgi:hypothetical protein